VRVSGGRKPDVAGRVSTWFAKRYYNAREVCSRGRAFRRLLFALLLLMVLWGVTSLVRSALRGENTYSILTIAGYVLIGVFFTEACYARPVGRLASLVGLLGLLAAVLLVLGAILWAVGWTT